MGVPMGRQPGVIKVTSTEAFKCSKTEEVFPVPGTLVCFLTPFQKWSHASPKGLGLLFHFPEGILPVPWALRLGLQRVHVLLPAQSHRVERAGSWHWPSGHCLEVSRGARRGKGRGRWSRAQVSHGASWGGRDSLICRAGGNHATAARTPGSVRTAGIKDGRGRLRRASVPSSGRRLGAHRLPNPGGKLE